MRRRAVQTDTRAPAPVQETPEGVKPLELFGDDSSSDDGFPGEAETTVAYEIETTTDALNEGLEEAEKALTALNLGTEGYVVLSRHGEFGDFERKVLFQKTKGGWKLLGQDADDSGEMPPVELLTARRELRIEAATKLDELLSLLLETSHGRLARLREAVEHVEAFRERIAREAKK